MTLGIIIKAFNCIHKRNYRDLLTEVLPQILLLLLIFGFMDALIIVKWLTNYTGVEHSAPSVITTMINIPLSYAKIDGTPFFPN